jgi:hypothetical protein
VTGAVGDVLGARELWVGAAMGAAGLVLIVASRAVSWGTALAGASVAGLVVLGELPAGLAMGLLGLTGGGWAARGRGAPVRAVAAVSGAALVALALPDSVPTWLRWSALATVVMAAVTLADFGSRHRASPIAGLLLPVTAGAVCLTTPDTELALVVFGVAAVLAIVTVLGRPTSWTPPSAFATAGLLVWVMASEARGRPASFVPAVVCLGMLVAEPAGHVFARLATRRAGIIRSPLAVAAGLVVHSLFAVTVARGPGRRSDPQEAAGVALALLAAAIVVAAAACILAPSREPSA